MLQVGRFVLTLERYEVIAITDPSHGMNVARLRRQYSQLINNFGFASLRSMHSWYSKAHDLGGGRANSLSLAKRLILR
ncbi:hypothetical protein D3C76_1451370 [compost metagenome]